MSAPGVVEMPYEVFRHLHDFVGQHRTDILLEMEDFDLLKVVEEWIDAIVEAEG